MTLATELKDLGTDGVMTTQQRQVRALEILLVAAKDGALNGLCLVASHAPHEGHCGATVIICPDDEIIHLGKHMQASMEACIALMVPAIMAIAEPMFDSPSQESTH